MPVYVKLRVHMRRTCTHTDASALLDLSRQRAEISAYMPAGADLVVNLARESFLEHVNTGLSSENFGLYARGGICHKSWSVRLLRSLHAEHNVCSDFDFQIRNIEIYHPFRHVMDAIANHPCAKTESTSQIK